jgi:hypothetical protein
VSIDPAAPRIGGHVNVSFEIVSTATRSQSVLADLVVHFVKARGTGAKTFKLRALRLEPGGKVALGKKIGLRQLTTRKHYPGRHRVEALINGRRMPLGEFRLR